MHELLGRNHDAHDTLDAHMRTRGNAGEGASCGYHPCRGERYDSGEDRSLSPDLLGPQAFGRHILNTIFPPWYRSLTNIPKYSRETNPELWLEDYQLACQADGAYSDDFIICNLPLFLANSHERGWNTFRPIESKVGRT